ncbi:MAG TPA: dTMP kinase [Acidimicrobiales bacterium]|nr:dTMP kinase [Acidimicrobiales bacterium]
MTTRGRLIALEGGEGAGKSTQASRLAAAIGAQITREPGGSRLGERVRQLLLDPEASEAAGRIDPRAELMLMLAARAQHVSELIRPHLESGRDVVVDRYSGSTLAYQGYGRGLPIEEVRHACDLATGGLWPDLTLLLDVPVEVGAGRKARAGGEPDRIEAERDGFHMRVRDGFLVEAAADPDRWVVIDGTLEPSEVEKLVRAAVDQVLGARA